MKQIRGQSPWWAAAVLVLLASGCGGPAPLPDTPELRLEKARELVRVEIEGGALDETLDLGTDLASDASVASLEAELGRELNLDEEARVRVVMRGALASIVTESAWSEAVAEVYARHFTPAEIQAAIDFFVSPAGARILALQGTVQDEVGDATEALLEDDLDSFIEAVDDAIAAQFPELETP